MAEDANNRNDAAVAPTMVPSISTTRLHVIIAGLWLCLFMSAMDTTIITTALIKVSSSFNALDQAAWLVTAYLLTYNSFLMITAKLSDVWALKSVLLLFTVFFLIFSMACSGAKTMTQLIIFRAFQGIGGSGLYSLVFVAIVKLISPENMAFYSGVVSSVFALANLLGPVLGGVITDHTNWRWIFWINGPIMGLAIALILFAMPSHKDGKSTKERLQGFDGIGGILSVSWPIPLLFALQEAGAQYDWNSGVIIGTLVAGVVLFFLFGAYEAWISYKTNIDAIFPARFLTNPCTALLLFSMLLLGMPFYVMFIQLPQRFQGVNFTSAERAGILLLPVSLLTPVGAMFSGVVMGKKFAPEYMLILSTAIISIGIGLLSSLPTTSHFSNSTYGYEIITGLALGLASPPYYSLLYTSVEEKDVTIGTGILNMVRTLGGAIAVAICSALHHSILQSDLAEFLSPEQIDAVEESAAYISKLPREGREALGKVFGKSYNKQFQTMLAFTLLNVVVAIIFAVLRKKQGIFGKLPERKEGNEFMQAVELEHEGTVEGKDFGAKDETKGDRLMNEGREREKDGQLDGVQMMPPSEGSKEDQKLKE